MQDVNNRGNCGWGESTLSVGNSLFSVQFFCEPKTALIKQNKTKQKQAMSQI